MLVCDQISKSFADQKALDNVTITLKEGSIFGLLGTNGAGKSTLLRVMSGIYRPDGGDVRLEDAKVYENPLCKQDICYLSDEPTFLHAASMREMGRWSEAHFTHFQWEKLLVLCAHFELPMDKSIHSFSKGTQKRAQLCLALSRNPKVLLCDETFDGLDPVMRDAFKRVINEETIDRQMITVLAGHNHQEMEDICDTIALLHEGKVVAGGELSGMLGGIQKVQCAFHHAVDEDAFATLSPIHVKRQGKLCVMTVRGEREAISAQIEALDPLFMEFLPLSLEEVFILEMEASGYVK